MSLCSQNPYYAITEGAAGDTSLKQLNKSFACFMTFMKTDRMITRVHAGCHHSGLCESRTDPGAWLDFLTHRKKRDRLPFMYKGALRAGATGRVSVPAVPERQFRVHWDHFCSCVVGELLLFTLLKTRVTLCRTKCRTFVCHACNHMTVIITMLRLRS